MAVAILLWKHTGALGSLYRVLLFLPVIVAPVVGSLIWQWMLHPIQGVANVAPAWIGIGPVNWLGSPSSAIWAIIAITGWKIFGLSFILYSAGLATVNRSYVDAAHTDGASEWEVTRHILVRLRAPTTILVSFLCVIFAGQWRFAAITVLTQGGPVGSTENVFSLLYQYAFRFFDTGAAAAVGVGAFRRVRRPGPGAATGRQALLVPRPPAQAPGGGRPGPTSSPPACASSWSSRCCGR